MLRHPFAGHALDFPLAGRDTSAMRRLLVLLFCLVATVAHAQTYCREGSEVFYDGDQMYAALGECEIRPQLDLPFKSAMFFCPDGLQGGIVADGTDMVISATTPDALPGAPRLVLKYTRCN